MEAGTEAERNGTEQNGDWTELRWNRGLNLLTDGTEGKNVQNDGTGV